MERMHLNCKTANAIIQLGGYLAVIADPQEKKKEARKLYGCGQITQDRIRRYVIHRLLNEIERGIPGAVERLREVNRYW